MSLAVPLALASANPLTASNAQAPTVPKETVQAVVSTTTNLEPISSKLVVPDILQRIAECESGSRQFDEEGRVIRGKENPDDIGKFQINLYWNGEKAKELGFDLFTEEGNTNMALWLYEHQGTKPWGWSKGCWNI